MRYEIDENNAILIWQDGQDIPFMFQPDYPDGSAFVDRADADAWAKAKIAELEDIEVPRAPLSPGESPQPQERKLRAIQDQHKADGIKALVKLGLSEDQANAVAGNF